MKTKTSMHEILRDAALIISGSFIYALGADCFQIPFDIAAGGITGLATVLCSNLALLFLSVRKPSYLICC